MCDTRKRRDFETTKKLQVQDVIRKPALVATIVTLALCLFLMGSLSAFDQ